MASLVAACLAFIEGSNTTSSYLYPSQSSHLSCMFHSKIEWYKIADSVNEISFADNNLFVTEAGGKKITLAKVNDKIFSCAYKCPHAGGIMSEGYIDALGNITCPLHRYKFSLVNGRNVSGEGFFLTVYPVEHRADGVYIGIKSGFSLF